MQMESFLCKKRDFAEGFGRPQEARKPKCKTRFLNKNLKWQREKLLKNIIDAN